MTTFTLFDTLTVEDGKTRTTANGYLLADVRVARVGIQDYLGSELGRPDMPIVRVYRSPDAVFASDAMASYAFKPMTNDHQGEITAANWKDHAVGMSSGDVVRDGDFVRVPLMMTDAAAIADYRNGKRELSMGYSAEIEFKDGVTPEGESYNAVLKDMRMNHVALVDRARGGSELRIGDHDAHRKPASEPTGGHQMPDTRKVMFDGLEIEVTAQGAQALDKVQRQLADSQTALKTATDKHAVELADRDTKLAKAEADRDDLKAKVMDAAAIDKMVAERADLISAAKAIHDADYTGKSAAEIKRAVTVAKLGDSRMAGKSEAYVDACWDNLLEDAKADPVQRALQDGAHRNVADAGNDPTGRLAREAAQRDAWKNAK